MAMEKINTEVHTTGGKIGKLVNPHSSHRFWEEGVTIVWRRVILQEGRGFEDHHHLSKI